MEFDEDGRIYVVEMHGYPLDTGPSGRVKLLRDSDGDGRPDLTTVFADDLVMPTGVMRWKKGVLVAAAPDILYFEDTDGDGRANIKKIVLTGFPFSNPQHTVNSPVYGLDNWIHLAYEGPSRGILFPQFSDPGQALRFPDRPDLAPVEVGRSAVRFSPDSFAAEPRSGETQFGHAFDAWGHYFTLNNSNHARHEVIAARYLKRNPDLLVQPQCRIFRIMAAMPESIPSTAIFVSRCSLSLVSLPPLVAWHSIGVVLSQLSTMASHL